MANIKSSKKSIRKIAKLTARNRAEKTRLKTFSKKLQKLQSTRDADAIKATAIAYMSVIDKAGKHGVLHANKVNRMKSRVTRLINVVIKSEPNEIASTTAEHMPEVGVPVEAISEGGAK